MDMFKNTHIVGVWYYQCLSFRSSYQEVSICNCNNPSWR